MLQLLVLIEELVSKLLRWQVKIDAHVSGNFHAKLAFGHLRYDLLDAYSLARLDYRQNNLFRLAFFELRDVRWCP